MNETTSDTNGATANMFRNACRSVLASWAMGALPALLASVLLAPENRQALVVITVASGVIAAAAMLGGALVPRLWTAARSTDRSSALRPFLIGAASGMVLRILGTVALFLTCRYQLAASAEMIVAWTIGWYVFLTSVEVIALGREVTRFVPAKVTSSVPAKVTSSVPAKVTSSVIDQPTVIART